MCVTDAPVILDATAPDGDFTGPGVSGGVFDPVSAGVGMHTISYESPGVGHMVESVTFAPLGAVTGTDVSAAVLDDNIVGPFPIGFDFEFFGEVVTDFRIVSNGYLLFDPAESDVGCCSGSVLPNTIEPLFIAAFGWGDLDPGSGGTIRYETSGTAPNRILTVEFVNVPHWSSGENFTSEIQLHETTNCIEVHVTDQASTASHTIGIHNQTGTEAATAPGRNGTGGTYANEAWSFCPNPGCISDSLVEVVASPTVDVTADVTEICLGEEVTLTATGTATEYSFGTGIEEGVPFTPTSTGENVFIVSGTDLVSGCAATGFTTVFVHDIPFISGGIDQTVCEGEEAILSGSSDDEEVTFVWDGGITDGVAFTQDIGITTYNVTGTNAGGCETSASVSVEVLEVPTGTGVVSLFTGLGFDGAIDFTPSGGTGTDYTFLWSNGATTEDVSALSVGEYTVTVSDGICQSDVTFIVDSQAGIELEELNNLSVYPNPFVNEFSIDFDGTYNWTVYDNAGKLLLKGQASNKEIVSLEGLATGTYHVNVSADGKASTITLVKK